MKSAVPCSHPCSHPSPCRAVSRWHDGRLHVRGMDVLSTDPLAINIGACCYVGSTIVSSCGGWDNLGTIFSEWFMLTFGFSRDIAPMLQQYLLTCPQAPGTVRARACGVIGTRKRQCPKSVCTCHARVRCSLTVHALHVTVLSRGARLRCTFYRVLFHNGRGDRSTFLTYCQWCASTGFTRQCPLSMPGESVGPGPTETVAVIVTGLSLSLSRKYSRLCPNCTPN